MNEALAGKTKIVPRSPETNRVTNFMWGIND